MKLKTNLKTLRTAPLSREHLKEFRIVRRVIKRRPLELEWKVFWGDELLDILPTRLEAMKYVSAKAQL